NLPAMDQLFHFFLGVGVVIRKNPQIHFGYPALFAEKMAKARRCSDSTNSGHCLAHQPIGGFLFTPCQVPVTLKKLRERIDWAVLWKPLPQFTHSLLRLGSDPCENHSIGSLDSRPRLTPSTEGENFVITERRCRIQD